MQIEIVQNKKPFLPSTRRRIDPGLSPLRFCSSARGSRVVPASASDRLERGHTSFLDRRAITASWTSQNPWTYKDTRFNWYLRTLNDQILWSLWRNRRAGEITDGTLNICNDRRCCIYSYYLKNKIKWENNILVESPACLLPAAQMAPLLLPGSSQRMTCHLPALHLQHPFQHSEWVHLFREEIRETTEERHRRPYHLSIFFPSSCHAWICFSSPGLQKMCLCVK